MSDSVRVIDRFLDEMTLLSDALGERLDAIEHAPDGDARLASLREAARLSAAVTDLAVAFDMSDVASLGEALAHAISTRIVANAQPPAVIFGARDTISYLHWRLAEIRRAGAIAALDQRAFSVAQALMAILASDGDGSAVIGSVASEGEDGLSELSPEERDIVRSFTTAELRLRDEALDARVLRGAVGALEHNDTRWSASSDDMDATEQLLVSKQSFIFETEHDLQKLSELIAAYRRAPDVQTHLGAMAHIAHKIRGTAGILGFPEFAQLALYLEKWAIFSSQHGSALSTEGIVVTLGRFLELGDTCLAAAGARKSPDLGVVEEARRLYDTATKSVDSLSHVTNVIAAVSRSGTTGSFNATRITDAQDARYQVGRETLLHVDSIRLDALLIHLSALALSRGSLAAAHARLAHAQNDMATTINRLHEKSAHVVDTYPLDRKNLSPTSALASHDSRDNEHIRQADNTPPAGLLRDSWRVEELEGSAEIDAELRALSEVVADVETLSAALSGALMQMGQLIEAQEIVIANIQHDATRMRLAPLAELTPRLEVLASYWASAFGKRVQFNIEGEMTEIDRSLMRALVEPLNQLVRNAITHGIELPEERVVAGKPEIGSVWIHAYYSGSEVVIEVGDDGRGVNTHALVARAISEGALGVDEARSLTPDAAIQLMFQPGVTALDRPSALAGGGVGLDEVATLIRELKGDIVVVHTSNQGTLFRIRVPITLTVLPTLEVSVGEQLFTTPFSSVVASFVDVAGMVQRVPQDQRSDSRGDIVEAPTMYRLALPAETAPLWPEGAHARLSLTPGAEISAFSLAECLGVVCDEPPSAAIVIERREQHIALLVGALGAMRETMVRPLPAYLKRKLIRGVTVRSEDGAIAFLVDVGELADQLLAGAVRPPHLASVRVAHPQPVARVLIVDDSVTIRRTLDQMLTRAGFSTALARDGYEALEMMENELPRVVILDVEMPRLNGYALLEIMRGSPKYDQTRVVILTSRAGMTHERQARDLGADEYLVKPCPQDTLISAVRRLLTDSEPS